MNVNTNYSSIIYNADMLNSASKNNKTGSAFNDLSAMESAGKQEDTVSKLTSEQKEYLRSKYDLSNLTFEYALPGDEETLRQAIRDGTYRQSGNFMEELHKMGLISDEEFNSYLNPTIWVFRPAGSEYLTMSGMCDLPAGCSPNSELGQTLLKDVSGENLLEAFRTLATQQKYRASAALGEESKNQYMKESAMYERLANLVSEIFS